MIALNHREFDWFAVCIVKPFKVIKQCVIYSETFVQYTSDQATMLKD